VITVELLCVAYFLIFASLIKLRYSQPDTPHVYRIPRGMIGVWIVGGAGLLGIVLCFIAGIMLQPSGIFSSGRTRTSLTILAGSILLAGPPLIFLRLKKPHRNPAVAAEMSDRVPREGWLARRGRPVIRAVYRDPP